MMTHFKNQVGALMRAWHSFWFTPVDPIVPSVMRIFVGGMLFYTLLVWGISLESFFSQSVGWQSAELVAALQDGEWVWSFWWLVPDRYVWTAHFVCLAIVFAFWVGLGTAITKWLSLGIVISYANRVPLANYGLDQFNTMLTMYLCLGPCGARLSVDRWLKKKLSQQEEFGFARRDGKMASASLSLRMIQVHLCVVYFFAGLSKLQGAAWWDGSAVWLAASNYEYQQVSLLWLVDFPWLYQVATLGTWVWEISFAFLVWNRVARPWVLLAGISMHIGIGMFMGMWTFGLIMCFAYIAFVPADLLRSILESPRMLRDTSRRENGLVFLDTEFGECRRAAMVVEKGEAVSSGEGAQ